MVSSFEEAVSLCNTRPLYDEIDSVWVMGGASIYKVYMYGFSSSLCLMIFLTYIMVSYKDWENLTMKSCHSWENLHTVDSEMFART